MVELKKVEKEKAKALQKQMEAAAAEVGKNDGELTLVMHLEYSLYAGLSIHQYFSVD